MRDDDFPICRTCSEAFPDGGDGWDGDCPSCADKSWLADDPEMAGQIAKVDENRADQNEYLAERFALDARELAMVLVALRFWQRVHDDNPFRSNAAGWKELNEMCWQQNIEPLCNDEIETLCERINT